MNYPTDLPCLHILLQSLIWYTPGYPLVDIDHQTHQLVLGLNILIVYLYNDHNEIDTALDSMDTLDLSETDLGGHESEVSILDQVSKSVEENNRLDEN
jgi:hypothetical protein